MRKRQKQYGTQVFRDYGTEPLIINIDRLANLNPNYRTTIWTGQYLQVTLMSIPPRGDIGLEMHPETDQWIRIENGRALVMMGKNREHLDIRQKADHHDAVILPAGTWHNIINIGSAPLKLYSVYAPPHHPFGTIHETKEDAQAAENADGHRS